MTACIVAGRAAWLPDQGQQIFNERSLITAPFVGEGCLEVNKAPCTEVFYTCPPLLSKADELELSSVQFLTTGECPPEKQAQELYELRPVHPYLSTQHPQCIVAGPCEEFFCTVSSHLLHGGVPQLLWGLPSQGFAFPDQELQGSWECLTGWHSHLSLISLNHTSSFLGHPLVAEWIGVKISPAAISSAFYYLRLARPEFQK